MKQEPRMSEVDFRVCAVWNRDGRYFRLYSRLNEDSYYHGEFDTIAEALASLELRCEACHIEYCAPHAKREIQRNTFWIEGQTRGAI